ncbi:glycosyltransferase family 4 protein [Sulfurimonas sp.]|uniref:glycosyltransferase family 4 protein n=1 Tax=Sulfurimonas sp. TaxID=2022749 RepID=UPI0019EFBB2D|nr:glycosyltransferase family 4 protein [Sulfurimonas sp.]MBE0515394.1 glycosyltransferase family 4 protein [Sulfurimonas sp.]
MQNILLINNGYPSQTNPQYSTYIKSIHDCLQESGLHVELLILDTNFKTKKEKIFKYMNYYKKLFLHDYSKHDYVYIHNYPHSFLPLIFKLSKMKNLTIHWHGTDIFAPSKLSKYLNMISYLFLPATAKHMTPSNYFADMVSEKLSIDRKKILVSPSGGIDTSIFKVQKINKKDEVVLGFASSMRTDKGMDFVLKLIQNAEEIEKLTNKKIKLLCINYGSEKAHYSDELQKVSNVKIIEPVPKNQMVTFYEQIDLLLLSTRMAESLALVGLEAMSCDVPVVGTNDFAIKEYVVDGISGEKFEKADFASFQKAVIAAINNLENYSPRDIVLKQYSKEHVVAQYKKYFGADNE